MISIPNMISILVVTARLLSRQISSLSGWVLRSMEPKQSLRACEVIESSHLVGNENYSYILAALSGVDLRDSAHRSACILVKFSDTSVNDGRDRGAVGASPRFTRLVEGVPWSTGKRFSMDLV